MSARGGSLWESGAVSMLVISHRAVNHTMKAAEKPTVPAEMLAAPRCWVRSEQNGERRWPSDALPGQSVPARGGSSPRATPSLGDLRLARGPVRRAGLQRTHGTAHLVHRAPTHRHQRPGTQEHTGQCRLTGPGRQAS